MKYHDLRDFLTLLEQQGELKRISLPVDPHLEMTEIADRTLRAGGPALLFENPKGYDMPVLCNLFGTPRRVAMGMGQEDVSALREVGKLLAFLKEPEPPKGFRDLFDKLPQFKQVLNMPTKRLRGAPYPRPAQRTAESGHLSPTGDWQKQTDYALAVASRRRVRFPGVVCCAPR